MKRLLPVLPLVLFATGAWALGGDVKPEVAYRQIACNLTLILTGTTGKALLTLVPVAAVAAGLMRKMTWRRAFLLMAAYALIFVCAFAFDYYVYMVLYFPAPGQRWVGASALSPWRDIVAVIELFSGYAIFALLARRVPWIIAIAVAVVVLVYGTAAYLLAHTFVNTWCFTTEIIR